MQINLNIGEPCSASWQEMTPASNGRYCSQCSKEVIDLSSLSDDEIAQKYITSKGNLCGRMKTAQLNKPFTVTQQSVGWKSAAALGLLALTYKGSEPVVKGETADKNTWHVSEEQLNVGFRISGTIKDEQGNIIPNAKINILANEKMIAQCYGISNGRYSIQLDLMKLNSPVISIQVSKEDYVSWMEETIISKTHHLEKDITLTTIKRNPPVKNVSEIVLLDEMNITETRPEQKNVEPISIYMLGGVCAMELISKEDTTEISNNVEKIEVEPVKTNQLFVYPNPVTDLVNIRMDLDAQYRLQIYSMDGKVLVDRPFTGTSTIEDVSHFMPGNYITNVIDESMVVMYSAKLVVIR